LPAGTALNASCLFNRGNKDTDQALLIAPDLLAGQIGRDDPGDQVGDAGGVPDRLDGHGGQFGDRVGDRAKETESLVETSKRQDAEHWRCGHDKPQVAAFRERALVRAYEDAEPG
jgi:hypothetical protein